MKSIALLLTTLLMLVGCSDDLKQEKEDVKAIESTATSDEVNDTENKNDTEKVVNKDVEKIVENEEVTNALSRDDVDALFSKDPDEKQYENAPLEFEYGDTVEVDYISYLGNDSIDYATALFFEDKLVQLQLDTSLSDDELEKLLGIDINEDLMIDDKRDRGVYEITFNGKFRESVIARYPFEMD